MHSPLGGSILYLSSANKNRVSYGASYCDVVISSCVIYNRHSSLLKHSSTIYQTLQLEMAKRGASFNSSSDNNPKLARSDTTTTLADVSTGVTGIYTLTKPVRIEGLHWRAACYNGCSTCSRVCYVNTIDMVLL